MIAEPIVQGITKSGTSAEVFTLRSVVIKKQLNCFKKQYYS